MSNWNEDNFLDELMPLLRQGRGSDSSAIHRCPDPETLCAVLDGAASEILTAAVAAHAMRCPACARLQQRLSDFQQAGGTDAEWSQTEKRLDNWLEGWLAAQPAGREQRAEGSSWWQNIAGSDRWRLQWVVVASLALVLAAGMFMIERGRTARRTTITGIPSIPIPPVPVQLPPDTKPSEELEKSLTAKNVEAVESAEPVKSPKRPAPSPAKGLPPAALPDTAPVETPPPQTASAGTPEPPPAAASHPANPLPAGAVRPVRMAQASARARGTLSTQAQGAVSTPARVRLDAGTRLWIFLKSFQGRPDQSFEFRGVVLLPVTQGRAVLLDQETEVYGTGSVSQGRTSVRIQQFGLHGARYRLTGPAVATGEQAPGAGGSLQFDAGQVLEMWLASASTYQRMSGEAGEP